MVIDGARIGMHIAVYHSRTRICANTVGDFYGTKGEDFNCGGRCKPEASLFGGIERGGL